MQKREEEQSRGQNDQKRPLFESSIKKTGPFPHFDYDFLVPKHHSHGQPHPSDEDLVGHKIMIFALL